MSKVAFGRKKFKTVVHMLDDTVNSDDMSAEQKTCVNLFCVCFFLI